MNVLDDRDRLAVVDDVEDDFPVRGRTEPLQHAPLLPAPGRRRRDRHPVDPLFEIDHAEADGVLRAGLPGRELRLHGEQVASGPVPGALVVIAEPVVVGAFRGSPGRHLDNRLGPRRLARDEGRCKGRHGQTREFPARRTFHVYLDGR